MSPNRTADLVRGILTDVDGAIAGITRPIEDRHSAAVSAGMLTIRLLGGACINLARLVNAAERIATAMEDRNDDRTTPPADPA